MKEPLARWEKSSKRQERGDHNGLVLKEPIKKSWKGNQKGKINTEELITKDLSQKNEKEKGREIRKKRVDRALLKRDSHGKTCLGPLPSLGGKKKKKILGEEGLAREKVTRRRTEGKCQEEKTHRVHTKGPKRKQKGKLKGIEERKPKGKVYKKKKKNSPTGGNSNSKKEKKEKNLED